MKNKLNLLIAEDNLLIQAQYKNSLLSEIFNTRVVDNGQSAIDEYLEWKPDLILLDIMMPLKTGADVVKEIREDIKDRDMPIIMCTSLVDEKEVGECRDLGVQGFIPKPFDEGKITRQILDLYMSVDEERAGSLLSAYEMVSSEKAIPSSNRSDDSGREDG